MYRNFLSELKKKRLLKGYSVDFLSKDTRISKKIIYKIEKLNEDELDSFPQKHLLFLYAKHLGVKVPNRELFVTHSSNVDKSRLSRNFEKINFFSSLISNFKFQITFPLLLVLAILVFNYSMQNNDLSTELILDNEEIIAQNNQKTVSNKNTLASNDQINKGMILPSVNNSKQSVSILNNKNNQIQETVSLSLTFDNEVWIEVDNSKEIIFSHVFAKGEQLNFEVLKKDEIFITSGNMGLISIKVGNDETKYLGSIGEIGRKQIF